MKRIEFIAPVESMRGNLSGSQKLAYPTDNNAAYDSPVGSRNYANNYQPRFIGAKRSSDNLKYFAVRTKSAIGMTARSKHAMALLGGAGAMIGVILNTPSYKASCEQVFDIATRAGKTSAKSLRQYLTEKLLEGLQAKSTIIAMTAHLGAESANFYARNPWVANASTVGGQTVSPSDKVLAKFWNELAANPIDFFVAGFGKGIAHVGDKFQDVSGNTYNVLGISMVSIDDVNYAGINVGDVSYVLTKQVQGEAQKVAFDAVVEAIDYGALLVEE